MAIKVDVLYPTGTDGQGFNPSTVYSAINSGATYDVTGYSSIVVQVDCPVDAALAGTLTVQASLDNHNWYDFPAAAISYTTVGLKPAINVEGVRFVRVQFTTTSGTVEVMLTICGVLNV
jgi:hypothetical protein